MELPAELVWGGAATLPVRGCHCTRHGCDGTGSWVLLLVINICIVNLGPIGFKVSSNPKHSVILQYITCLGYGSKLRMLNKVWLQGSQICFLICFSSHIYVFLTLFLYNMPFDDILIFLTTLSENRKKKRDPLFLGFPSDYLPEEHKAVNAHWIEFHCQCPLSWRAVLGSRCGHTERNRIYTQQPQQQEMEMFGKCIRGFQLSRDFHKTQFQADSPEFIDFLHVEVGR